MPLNPTTPQCFSSKPWRTRGSYPRSKWMASTANRLPAPSVQWKPGLISLGTGVAGQQVLGVLDILLQGGRLAAELALLDLPLARRKVRAAITALTSRQSRANGTAPSSVTVGIAGAFPVKHRSADHRYHAATHGRGRDVDPGNIQSSEWIATGAGGSYAFRGAREWIGDTCRVPAQRSDNVRSRIQRQRFALYDPYRE
jgi:hypothetical protein